MGKRKMLRVLCADGDREALQPILDALKARGVSASDSAKPAGKDVLLAVLSERFYTDGTRKNALLEAVSSGTENVLPLRLDKAEQPPEIKTALYARNIIPADERSAEQTAERIIAALPQEKKPVGKLLLAGAAALAVLAGVLIWRALPREEEEPAAPPAVQDYQIPAGIDLNAEDLKNIRSVVIVGEEYHFLSNGTPQPNQSAPNVHDYAVENGDGWFSREDGHEYGMTRYDDLRFLALMPNLKSLSFALVDIPELPDLSGTQLRTVEFFDCAIDRLDWFDSEKLEQVTLYGCPVTDFSPLNTSTQSLNANIGLPEGTGADLSGFHPEKLRSLNLNGDPSRISMPDLSLCRNLHELRLENLPVEDLDFLRGSSVYRLFVRCERLRDISGLAGMERLNEAEIRGCRQVRDFSALGACPSLQKLLLDTEDEDTIRDVSFLEGLQNLRRIELHGCDIPDLNFLRSIASQRQVLNFGFRGRCGDFSGLGEVRKYEYLYLNLHEQGFSAAAPYLENAEIDDLSLVSSRNLDFGLIPRGTLHLQLRDCSFGSDLSALPDLHLTALRLEDIPLLRSLDGLQNLPRFGGNGIGALQIRNCPRLTDWSPLEGMDLDGLELAGVYSLPDFSKMHFHWLKLDSLDWVEDLSCLDALDGSYQGYKSFSLPGMEQIRDLSPIARVISSSGQLEVPPQLEEQARELQQQGKIMWYSVVYPEGGWEMDNAELSLLSLDELETLPGALLRRVTTLAVAGETVFDASDFEVWNRWENNAEHYYLVDRRTREETPVGGMGAVTDLNAFSALTGLRRLILVSQPIAGLEGLENMENLRELELKNCANLHDLSPAFAMQSLEHVFVDHSPAESIQGVQNLYRLQGLGLNYTQVPDISPLAECDFGEAMQRGGLELDLDNIPCGDFSALESVPHYRRLNVNNIDCTLWLEAVQGCEIEELECVNAHIGDEELKELTAGHPELRAICLSWTQELTDLTPLLELPSLERVRISRNMNAAIESLKGKDIPFELNIEG